MDVIELLKKVLIQRQEENNLSVVLTTWIINFNNNKLIFFQHFVHANPKFTGPKCTLRRGVVPTAKKRIDDTTSQNMGYPSLSTTQNH